VGERVDLALITGGADGLSSGEITITFAADGFSVADVQPGPFLSIDGKSVTFVPVIEEGRIRIQFSRQDATIGLRGSGHVARIVLEVLSAGPRRVISATGTLRDASNAVIPASFASARIETR